MFITHSFDTFVQALAATSDECACHGPSFFKTLTLLVSVQPLGWLSPHTQAHFSQRTISGTIYELSTELPGSSNCRRYSPESLRPSSFVRESVLSLSDLEFAQLVVWRRNFPFTAHLAGRMAEWVSKIWWRAPPNSAWFSSSCVKGRRICPGHPLQV